MKKVTLTIIGLAITTAMFAQVDARQTARPVQGNKNQVIVEQRVDQHARPVDDHLGTNDILFSKEYLRSFREFATREARLTTREANQFFTLFDALQNKKHALNHEIMLAEYKLESRGLTEREAQRIIDRLADIDIEIAKLEKSYLAKYKRILSASKILRIKVAEQEFQQIYIDEIQRRRYEQVYSTMPVSPRVEPNQTPSRTTVPQNNRRQR